MQTGGWCASEECAPPAGINPRLTSDSRRIELALFPMRFMPHGFPLRAIGGKVYGCPVKIPGDDCGPAGHHSTCDACSRQRRNDQINYVLRSLILSGRTQAGNFALLYKCGFGICGCVIPRSVLVYMYEQKSFPPAPCGHPMAT